MEISNIKKILPESEAKISTTEEESPTVEKDYRDLENSLTDWDAEQNQSGRHK